jgi:murein L,D-transpeptidase YafK
MHPRRRLVRFYKMAAWLLACLAAANAQEIDPDIGLHDARDALPNLRSGRPVIIRIFKEESQLELWMQSGDRFQLVATYPICFWSGVLGPKFQEGDRQAPEGFYTIGPRQLVLTGRHAHSLDIGFPNAFDRSLDRTGSHILLHGGCRSVGCFAMTDAVMDNLYALAEAALRGGQAEIPLHIFPFRMTEANFLRHSVSPWQAFWNNLKQVYNAFEATHTPPVIRACRGTYRVMRDEEMRQVEGSEDCAVPPEVLAEGKQAQGLARRTAIPHHAGPRMAMATQPPMARPVRSVSTPITLPRDNVAECNRLWSRSTGIALEGWRAICKRLDFQPRRPARTAHRPG